MEKTILLPRPSLKASLTTSSSSSKTAMAPPLPIPRTTFASRQIPNTSTHLSKTRQQQQQQGGLLKTSSSIISTIQQIKIDFDLRRSVNAENKLKLTDLKSQIIYLKNVTAQLSSRIMSINAGIAFRERKEIISTREDVDELGLFFERLDKQTKHLIERLETAQIYTVNFNNSGNALRKIIESMSAIYEDVQSKIQFQEQEYSETMASHQNVINNALQATMEHEKLMDIICKEEIEMKQRKEVADELDQEVEKLKSSVQINQAKAQRLESEKETSVDAKRNTSLDTQKSAEAIMSALKAIYEKIQSLEAEIEHHIHELDSIKSKIGLIEKENDEINGGVLRSVDLLDNLREYVRQEDSHNLSESEVKTQVNVLKEEIRTMSDELNIKVGDLDSYKNALSDMENVRSKRLENLKATDAMLVSLNKEISSHTTDTSKSSDFHSNIESTHEEIIKLTEALQVSTNNVQSIHDQLSLAKNSLHTSQNKESELTIISNESNSFLVNIIGKHDLQLTVEKSNEDLALNIEKNQQNLIEERSKLTHLRANSSDVYANMMKLKKQGETITVTPNRNEVDDLKHEICILHSQMKNLQSGHSKFATLDENRNQELLELQKAIQHEEEKCDTGPRRRQHLRERQQKQNQREKIKSLCVSSSNDPSPSIDSTPEDSDSNDFFFSTAPNLTNQTATYLSENRDNPQKKTTISRTTGNKAQIRPPTDEKKKQTITSPITDPNIISLDHASASKVLRCKPIKKNKRFDNKHWLQNKDW